jgi:hypothetical protein
MHTSERFNTDFQSKLIESHWRTQLPKLKCPMAGLYHACVCLLHGQLQEEAEGLLYNKVLLVSFHRWHKQSTGKTCLDAGIEGRELNSSELERSSTDASL